MRETNKINNNALIISYVKSLSKSSGLTIQKTSEVNLANSLDLMVHSQLAAAQKHIISQADAAYKTIHFKLMGNIKTHLNHQALKFDNNALSNNGNLKFNTPVLYLKYLNEGRISGERVVTPTDSAIAYEFLMFRSINGNDAFKMEPDYIISFQKNGDKSYTNNDVVDTFSYKNKDHLPIQGHITQNNKKAVNKEAISILTEDKTEVRDIVKNVFGEYAQDCNVLKNTEVPYQSLICQSFTDISSPDYFIDMLTCLEVYNLAKSPQLCPELVYEEECQF